MVTVAMMSVLSGQRIALALVPVVVLVLLVVTGQIVNLKKFLPIGILLALVLTFLAARNPDLVNERVESLRGRWEASPPHTFVIQQLQWAQRRQQGLLGRGLGRATNAARIYGKTQ
ncbi:MAG: hypothetical protein AAFW75_27265, partial [Cyanobacteria bacterium J06636_16]